MPLGKAQKSKKAFEIKVFSFFAPYISGRVKHSRYLFSLFYLSSYNFSYKSELSLLHRFKMRKKGKINLGVVSVLFFFIYLRRTIKNIYYED